MPFLVANFSSNTLDFQGFKLKKLLKTKKNNILIGVFLLLHGLNILANGTDSLFFVRFFTQPALTLLLAVLFWNNSHHLLVQERYFVMGALGCLLLGDLALFNHGQPKWFLVGMVFFLLANVLYAMALQFSSTYTIMKVLIIGGLMMAYAYALLTVIVEGLGNYFVPVIIFMVSVFGLVQTAFSRFGNVNQISYWLVFIGTLCFLVSDSIIAINQFYKVLPFGNYLSLFFYGTSQLFIIYGFLKQDVKNELVLTNEKS